MSMAHSENQHVFLADAATGFFLFGVLVCLYFLPTIIGKTREVSSLGSILVINIFLGWTLVGWVIALAMAVRTVSPPVGVNPQPPVPNQPRPMFPPSPDAQVAAPHANPAESADSVRVSDLEKLAALHGQGVLTDEEFRAAKARVLGTADAGQ